MSRFCFLKFEICQEHHESLSNVCLEASCQSGSSAAMLCSECIELHHAQHRTMDMPHFASEFNQQLASQQVIFEHQSSQWVALLEKNLALVSRKFQNHIRSLQQQAHSHPLSARFPKNYAKHRMKDFDLQDLKRNFNLVELKQSTMKTFQVKSLFNYAEFTTLFNQLNHDLHSLLQQLDFGFEKYVDLVEFVDEAIAQRREFQIIHENKMSLTYGIKRIEQGFEIRMHQKWKLNEEGITDLKFVDAERVLYSSPHGNRLKTVNFKFNDTENVISIKNDDWITCYDYSQHLRILGVGTNSGGLKVYSYAIDESEGRVWKIMQKQDVHNPIEQVVVDESSQQIIFCSKDVLVASYYAKQTLYFQSIQDCGVRSTLSLGFEARVHSLWRTKEFVIAASRSEVGWVCVRSRKVRRVRRELGINRMLASSGEVYLLGDKSVEVHRLIAESGELVRRTEWPESVRVRNGTVVEEFGLVVLGLLDVEVQPRMSIWQAVREQKLCELPVQGILSIASRGDTVLTGDIQGWVHVYKVRSM